jgi:RNase P subunit RPR2
MERVRKGKQLANGVVVLRSGTGAADLRRMRCTSCHGNMVTGKNASGKETSRCTNCGSTATSRPM